MSKALSGAATRPTSDSEFVLPPPLLALLAAGVCTLVGWTVLRVARPEKFYLRRVPGRPNHLNPLHVLAAFLVCLLCTDVARLALSAAGMNSARQPHTPGKAAITAGIFGQVAWIAATVVVASMSFRHGLRRGMGLTGRRFLWDSGRAVVGFLVALPICVAAKWLTYLLIRHGILPIKPSEHPVLQFLETATAAWKVIAAFTAVVLAPLAEELFFRGLVQSMLRRYLRGSWPAILAASALFAATHLRQLQDWPALFVLAIVLGYNYERTGRLLAPILLHAIFNGAMIWGELAH